MLVMSMAYNHSRTGRGRSVIASLHAAENARLRVTVEHAGASTA